MLSSCMFFSDFQCFLNSNPLRRRRLDNKDRQLKNAKVKDDLVLSSSQFCVLTVFFV